MAHGASIPVTAPAATVLPEERGALMRRATYASVAVASLLIVAKTGAWAITDSVSVLSSLLDSLLDAAASLVNLFAVRHALAPADAEHRFGHGKAEALAGLAQAAFIGGSALLLLSEAVHRLWTPVPVTSGEVGIAVMALSMALTFALVRYQIYVVTRTGSLAVGADRLHYASDFLLNGAVIVSLLASMVFRIDILDPLAGLAIGAYILWGAAKIGRDALDHLMDRELPEETREKIIAIARANPLILDVHDLRTRAVGPNISVQMHLEIDGNLTLHQAHGAADAVEEAVMAAFPGSDVIVHMDPAGIVENRRDAH
ncbi:MAG: cation diffusion facilitator family transporter [Alphaproteobacteria bacterium]|nr:cation diffusion facilitator family transporter [Alphaproteobacteria bacterium]